MIKSFFKIAFRNLFRKKIYTFINIFGLAAGMAICLLIVLFIKSETRYDAFHTNANNIYRMVVERHYPGRNTSYSIIPQSYSVAVKQEFPEVKEAVRVFSFLDQNFLIRIDNRVFEEQNVLQADSTFFAIFSAKMLAGNASDCLDKPNSVVLNETTAKKYFGSVQNALNKTLQPEGVNAQPLLVTAIMENWPAQSHFNFDLLLTTAGADFFRDENFVNFAAYTYLLLGDNADANRLQAKFPGLIEKYAKGNIEKQFAQSFDDFTKAGNGYTYYLQPLKNIHLNSHLEEELRPNGSLQAVYIFSIVAVFILLIACINFINLSTARSAERAKEIGIRKTFGSQTKTLVAQFLAESVLLSFFSMLLGIAFIYFLIPLFNQISGKEIAVTAVFQWSNLLILLSIALFTGLVAGLYPAFVLSSFRPVVVLRGKFKSGSRGLALRNGLVIFQFAVSVILIICTIIVNKQMNFMTGQQLGFDVSHSIIIQRTDLLNDKMKAFQNEIKKIPGVEYISATSAMPATSNYFGTSWQVAGNPVPVTGRGIITDEEYAESLRLQVKEGRFFSKDYPTDSLAIVLNEKAVSDMGLQKPIGTRLTSPDELYNAPDGTPYTYTVIGVVKDFHYQNLHEPIAPLVFVNASKFTNPMFLTTVKIKADNFNATVVEAEQIWKQFVPDRQFHYTFLDRTVAQQYEAEQAVQRIFTFFSLLAIIIACIGLFGLAAYATQQRTREIGIRKVLGASAADITGMLSKDFLKLVLVASIVAFPLAWWGMHKWLQDFAYRIDISWWVFVVATIAAVFIALATISFQAIKAAIANPVKSLRTE